MDLSHIKKKFIEEADGLLTNLDNVLIELEKDPKGIQHINEAFRVMHTIKGASGMFGFEKIVEITHEIESLYDLVRNNQAQITQPLLELTFLAADHIRALLTDEALANEENINRHTVLLKNILVFKKGKEIIKTEPIATPISEKQKIISTWNILFYPNDEIIRRAVNIVYTFQDLFLLGEYKIYHQPFKSKVEQYWNVFLITDKGYDEIESALMFILDYCKIVKIADYNIFDPEALNKKHEEIEKKEYKPVQETTENTPIVLQGISPIKKENIEVGSKLVTTRINVESGKLDTLMYLVSELVTTKSELLLALKNQNETRVVDAAEKIEKLSKLFSENALSIRLVSLHEMLNKFKRLIRDLSKQLGKNINFEIVGEETELDKNIIDAIGEPIMHIIRNHIDHGIEIPERRLEKGKPEAGIIKFEAQKNGNFVFLSISDDGNGIDTDFIYQKAIEKGFIDAGSQLSKKEILDLIFLPGFSTAQNLSNVSGRGVGMDIVLKKIQEIRGEILIESEFNKGTIFNIKLQQTISIINTLLISSGNITYAVPIEDIEACVLERHESFVGKQNNLIEFDKSLIPFINLREKYTYSGFETENEKLIVINKRNKRYALIADVIIGEYQTVIKPLGDTFKDIKFLSGACLLGDGSIAFLLDTDQLWIEISGVQ